MISNCSKCGGEPYCTTYVPKEPPWKCKHDIRCKNCDNHTQRYFTHAEASEEWEKINEVKG